MNVYVVYKTAEIARKAVSTIHASVLEGKHLRASLSTEKETDTETTVFVGGLPFDATEEEVREHFKDCGEIDMVRLIRDRKTNVGKGIGYVKFMGEREMKAAIALNKSHLKKREIRVYKAVPPGKLKPSKVANRRFFAKRTGQSFEGERATKKKNYIRTKSKGSGSGKKGGKKTKTEKKKKKEVKTKKKVKMH